MDTLTKFCKSCCKDKEIALFKSSLASNGKRYVRSKCKTCWNRDNETYGDQAKRDARKKACSERAEQRARQKVLDFDSRSVARCIKRDSAASDRKKGYDNDLDIDFIVKMIEMDCSYCDRDCRSCRMTLDRVDNNLGHLRSNVVTSCQTCNLVRGNMPYEAWLVVAPGMRSARVSGLLDGRDGPRLNRKTKL